MRLPDAEDPGSTGLYRPNRKILYVLLAVIAVVIVARIAAGGSGGDAQILPTSCTKAAVALADSTVAAQGELRLEVTGPQAGTYAVWIDAASAHRGPNGEPTAVPLIPGRPSELLVPPTQLTGCRLVTAQPVAERVARGTHDVSLFAVAPDGTETQLATGQVTVT